MSSDGILAVFTPQIRYAIIDGYDGAYRVSDYGTVQTSKKCVGRHTYDAGGPWRDLELYKDPKGYLFVSLSYQGTSKIHYVAQLVCHYFKGPRPEPGLICCHNNDQKTDNHFTNVRWDSYSSNNGRDRVLNNSDLSGEKNPLAKLTWTQVLDIRERGSLAKPVRVPIKTLAREYNVSTTNIRAVLEYKTWKES